MAQTHGTSLVPADGMNPDTVEKISKLRMGLLNAIDEQADWGNIVKALMNMINKASDPNSGVGANRTALKAILALKDIMDSLTPKVRVNAGSVNINQSGVDRAMPVPVEDLPSSEFAEAARRLHEKAKKEAKEE